MRYVEVCNCDAQSNYECGGMMKPYCDYVKLCKCAEVALCAGRHDIPQAVDGCIFDEIEDVTDVLHLEVVATRKLRALGVKFIDLYVTGLTPALIATLNAAHTAKIVVMLYHYDCKTGEYFHQPVRM